MVTHARVTSLKRPIDAGNLPRQLSIYHITRFFWYRKVAQYDTHEDEAWAFPLDEEKGEVVRFRNVDRIFKISYVKPPIMI